MVEHKLLHKNLSSASVLIHADGMAKLGTESKVFWASHRLTFDTAPPEFWQKAGDEDVEEMCVTFLNNVLVQIMENGGLHNAAGRIRLRDAEVWSSTAQDFMHELAQLSASLAKLKEVCLVDQRPAACTDKWYSTNLSAMLIGCPCEILSTWHA